MKFNSKPIPNHEEIPLADDGLLEEVIDRWTLRTPKPGESTRSKNNSCYVLSVSHDRDSHIQKAQLTEIVSLVEAQGDKVVGQEVYYLRKKHPKTLIGKGSSQEIAARAHALDANLLVIDADLSPSQMRNLEDVAGISICDREAIILNVFLRHAKTRNAKIQVEIAQLEYLRPRIRGIGLDMDQQAGGIAGGRGPGETASELLARKMDGRLSELKKMQRRFEQVGDNQRQTRDQCKRIALIGYTNAGKTSLMNALVGEQLSAKNMPFETLDTTSRCLCRHGGDVIISDTVGFIRRLPKSLLPSFESTLAEIKESSLLIIVVDVSDYEWQEHLATTTALVAKLGAEDIPRYYVFNKVDRLTDSVDSDQLIECTQNFPYATITTSSAKDIASLKEELLSCVRREQKAVKFFVPYTASDALNLVYGYCRILESDAQDNGLFFEVQAPTEVIAKIESKLEEKIQ